MIFYDFEVFKKDWLVVVATATNRSLKTIVNNLEELQQFYEDNKNNIWVGYNSRNYDQYILKGLLLDFNPYDISQFIIKERRKGWEYSRAFNQIQLYNFDIMTTFHGLKQLEGFMGNDIRESSVDFNIETKLTQEQLKEVEEYCKHDVMQTIEVFCNRIEEFESQMSLIKAFKLPLSYIGKTKPQLSSIILGASKTKRDDEFNISIPNTLKLSKYDYVRKWYQDKNNHHYKKKLETKIANVEHTFAWGGVHGAIKKYHGEGVFLNCDVASLYPALMIEYGYQSRNVEDSTKYKEIRDTRLKLKAEKNPMQAPYKIVLNSTYGAMKDRYNPLYDPLMANNVCIAGQLLLLDLIEKLEPYGELIQSNTDGLFMKVEEKNIDIIKEVAKEWEIRTRLDLEWETFERIYQKDVNNYIIIHSDNSYKSKGAYIKKLNVLDNDLPIINKALINYFLYKTPVDVTIRTCNNLMEFQKIVKVSGKYMYGLHGDEVLKEKVLRVFASRSRSDKGVFKRKSQDRKEKIANTPSRCFILNESVNGMTIPRKLDIKWYIDLAEKRLKDFGKLVV